jgi:hypothetical protein
MVLDHKVIKFEYKVISFEDEIVSYIALPKNHNRNTFANQLFSFQNTYKTSLDNILTSLNEIDDLCKPLIMVSF